MGGVAAVVGVLGTAVSVAQQMSAADAQKAAARDAEKLARENALNIEAEGKREADIMRRQQDELEAETRARAAASGLVGGSHDIYLSDMERQHGEALDWLSKSTSSRSRIARREGKYASGQAKASASSTMAGAVGTAASGVSDFANWWGS